MQSSLEWVEDVIRHLSSYCHEKNYHIIINDLEHGKSMIISNLHEKTIVNIYDSQKLVIQGKENSLKKEFNDVKIEICRVMNSNHSIKELKQENTRYNILLLSIRNSVKNSLNDIGGVISFVKDPASTIDYIAKIERNSSSVVITQYKNGTLLLQGKSDLLFSDCCDLIEKVASPTKNEVIKRFISEENCSYKVPDETIYKAQENVKIKVGKVYTYLEPHDQIWFVASECLCTIEIPLQEYSYVVMPAAKALEGFTKKLLVDIRYIDENYFKQKGATFSCLKNPNKEKMKVISEKRVHAQTMLHQLSLDLDKYRNFVMHSDNEYITKVNTKEQAIELVDSIFKDTREIFDYFNEGFDLV